MTFLQPRRPARLALLAAALAATACLGETVGVDDDRVTQIRLFASNPNGVLLVVVHDDGRIDGTRLSVPIGISTLTAIPANSNGSAVSGAALPPLRLRVEVPAGNAGGVSFQPDPSNPLAGALTATTETPNGDPVLVTVALERVADGTAVIGPHRLPVLVFLGPR